MGWRSSCFVKVHHTLIILAIAHRLTLQRDSIDNQNINLGNSTPKQYLNERTLWS